VEEKFGTLFFTGSMWCMFMRLMLENVVHGGLSITKRTLRARKAANVKF
jgi:hypothetical protein